MEVFVVNAVITYLTTPPTHCPWRGVAWQFWGEEYNDSISRLTYYLGGSSHSWVGELFVGIHSVFYWSEIAENMPMGRAPSCKNPATFWSRGNLGKNDHAELEMGSLQICGEYFITWDVM